MMAPGLPQIGQHFHETNPTIIGMSLSILLLAWVFSPLIIAPLSEVYGREHTSPSPNYVPCSRPLREMVVSHQQSLEPRLHSCMRVCTDNGKLHCFPIPL